MCLSIRWICTKSKFDLCHTCNTELATQQLDAKQAEAEREKRAKVISAQGEFDSSKILSDAAKILDENKNAIVLRYLDTMREISSGEGKSTTFFPLPIDFLNKLTEK